MAEATPLKPVALGPPTELPWVGPASEEAIAAADLIERIAIGDEGDDRRRNIQLILDEGQASKEICLEALKAAFARLDQLQNAIATIWGVTRE